MHGYLLDTNHIQAYSRNDPKFIDRLYEFTPEKSIIFVCAITLGELEAGHRITVSTNPVERKRVDEFIRRELTLTCKIADTTKLYYANIMERIWQAYPPTQGTGTQAHLSAQGVDVNDLWTVASAWEHGLVLLTSDKMSYLRNLVKEVTFDCWI